jgi:uncharacterized protein YoaH (UPF0181 family)
MGSPEERIQKLLAEGRSSAAASVLANNIDKFSSKEVKNFNGRIMASTAGSTGKGEPFTANHISGKTPRNGGARGL